MKYFEHESAATFDEAVSLLKESPKGKTVVMAGGSDLIGVLKEQILEDYPEKVVDLKTVRGGEYIKQDGDTIEIGALTKLCDIVKSDLLNEKAPVLSQAARSVATPLIRNVATMGGNICQDVRCWFYRYPHGIGGRMDCMRKGGKECYAVMGDNRYHSIFGGMKVHTTPCSVQCPANTDIPAYMERLREGDVEGAAHILMEANPIPMITSRVCAHTCQEQCNRCGSDESVSIHGVERYVGDYILEHPDTFYRAPETETGHKVALVGAGPAGLSAAYYLRKAGHDVTVFDKMEEPGGMLTYAIPNYRLPKSYVKQVAAAYEKMGIRFRLGCCLGEDIQAEDLEKEYDNVFYATGAWKRPVLGFDGEEFTEFGLQFLMEVNQWMNKKDRRHVLVVGGGNVAMDVAITARRLGAESVTLACLESEPEMPASREEIARAREEGIEIMPSYGVSKAIYEGSQVTGMELMRCTSVKDENGQDTEQTWLDRNLGAKGIAAASNDHTAFGSLFQWSRKADGHEKTKWTSATAGSFVNALAPLNTPTADRRESGREGFMPTNKEPHDWARDDTSNRDGLWGGRFEDKTYAAPLDAATQDNNPCPPGYRVPTVNEFIEMAKAVTGLETMVYGDTSYKVTDLAAVFARSPLKMPWAGQAVVGGTVSGGRGVYWTNMPIIAGAGNIFTNAARFIMLNGTSVYLNNYQRTNAYSVRCIRHTPLDKASAEMR